MLNFDLTPEQKEIQTTALKFATEKMRPVAQELDEKEEFPLQLFEEAWNLGFINSCIPPEFGGTGFSTMDSVIISESLAYGCMGMNTCFMANDLALLPIAIAGNDEQKKKFLTPFTESFKIASFCLTEPANGSDAAGIKTTIKEDGDDIVVNGEKMWITNAGHADLFVVYGTSDSKLKHKGISAVVIPKDTPGIKLGKKEEKMGHRCSDTRAVSFQNVKVPKDHLLQNLGDGWKIAMQTLDHSRPLVSSSAVGGAQAALDHAKKYALERHQFGVPIAKHQAIQLMLADMAMKVEASKLLTYKAAWLLDNKQRNTEVASYAKAFAADACMEIATDAVQIFGGYGYSKEYPVEKIMRDAKLIQIYEGTSQIQRLVIAREILNG